MQNGTGRKTMSQALNVNWTRDLVEMRKLLPTIIVQVDALAAGALYSDQILREFSAKNSHESTTIPTTQ